MESATDPLAHLEALAREALAWLTSDLFAYATLAQLGALLLALALAHLMGRALCRLLAKLPEDLPFFSRIAPYLEPCYFPAIALLLTATGGLVARRYELPAYLLEIAASLLTAWLVIRLSVNIIRSRALRKVVATVALTLAALDIVGLLDPLAATLDAARLTVGEVTISALGVLKGAVIFVVVIWAALLLARLVERRIDALSDVAPSARELVKKLARIALVAFALLLGLNATGIDLTALAVFSGALGVGLGFGLQKVVANFVSGVILLMDRSIKPGDVIETQNTYGWINHLGARYTSIITRDGTEFLIPNEDMITQPVINWSFSDRKVRRKIQVSVAYSTDLREAMRLMEEAAMGVSRVLGDPAPASRILAFGDNGVELELRIWIEDPQSGVVNVASEVMLAIWDRFHEAGIEFPFPQRVVHMAGRADPESSVEGGSPAPES